jgi:hypothetical protein
MVRTALLLAAPAVLAIACIVPPDDATQIRALVHGRAAAIDRGDRVTLYRLHDIDYRAVCPLARFEALPAPEVETVLGVEAITVRGVRGSALVDVETSSGRHRDRREFVKDAGRWYLYEDAAPCYG